MYLDRKIQYHPKINIIFVTTPIFKRIHGDNADVSTRLYKNINEWMKTINHFIEQGCNTMYLYDFFIENEWLIVRQSFFTEI